MKIKLILLSALFSVLGGTNIWAQGWVGEEKANLNFYLYNYGDDLWISNNNNSPSSSSNQSDAILFTIDGNSLYYGDKNHYLRNEKGSAIFSGTYKSGWSTVTPSHTWDGNKDGWRLSDKTLIETNDTRFLAAGSGWLSFPKKSTLQGDNYKKWILISAEQVTEVNARATGIQTFEAAKGNAGFDDAKVDASCFVVNRNIDWKGGWQTNVNNATLTYQNNDEYPTQYVQVYNGGGVKGKIYQTTSQALPKGSYRMDITSAAHGQNSQSQSVYVYLKATTGNTKDGKQYIQSDNDPSKRNYSVFAYIDTDSPLEFGVEAIDNSSTWLSLDNVTLYYLGTNDVVAYYEKLKAFRTAYNSLKNYATENSSKLPSALNAEIQSKLSTSNTIGTGESIVTYETLLAVNAQYNETDLQAATTALNDELTKVKQIESQYEHINNYLSIFGGQFPQEIASAQAALDNCTTLEALENVLNTLRNNIAVSNYGAGTDLTILVKNNSFDMGTIQYWTSDNPVPAATPTSGENGTDGAFLYKGTAVLSQQIATGLKEGVYRVKAMVAGTDVKITLNNDAIENWTITNTEYTNLKEDTARVIVPADGSLTIKISANGEFKVDNVQLQYLGATGQSKADFETLVQNGQQKRDALLGFDNGQYAPYNNIAALTALKEAERVYNVYKDHQGVIPPYTAAETDRMFTDLAAWTPNSQKMDAVYDGNFAVQAENTTSPVDVKGWISSGQAGLRQIIANTESYPGLNNATNKKAMYVWGSQSYSYGTKEGYNMPLKANTGYVLSLKYAGWDGALNSLSASVLKGEEGLQTITLGGAEKGINTENSLVTKTVKFMTGEAGDYVLTLSPAGNAVFTDISIVEANKVDLTAKVSSALWGTFIAPFEVDLAGSDIIAYTCENIENNVLALTPVANEGKSIPANTPVILNSTAADSKTVNGYNIANEDSYTVGLLTGVYTATTAENGWYVLQNNDNKVGFYLVSEGSAHPTVGANRCYMTVPEGGDNARAFYLGEEEETAVATIEALATGTSEIYDLNGIRTNHLQKGINIVKLANGKTQKVIVK